MIGATDIASALDRALRHLATAGRPDALGVILLLTDGEPSDVDADDAQVVEPVMERFVVLPYPAVGGVDHAGPVLEPLIDQLLRNKLVQLERGQRGHLGREVVVAGALAADRQAEEVDEAVHAQHQVTAHPAQEQADVDDLDGGAGARRVDAVDIDPLIGLGVSNEVPEGDEAVLVEVQVGVEPEGCGWRAAPSRGAASCWALLLAVLATAPMATAQEYVLVFQLR